MKLPNFETPGKRMLLKVPSFFFMALVLAILIQIGAEKSYAQTAPSAINTPRCINSSKANFSWTAAPNVNKYILRIDKKDNVDSEWAPGVNRPTDQWVCVTGTSVDRDIVGGAQYESVSVQSASGDGCGTKYGAQVFLQLPASKTICEATTARIDRVSGSGLSFSASWNDTAPSRKVALAKCTNSSCTSTGSVGATCPTGWSKSPSGEWCGYTLGGSSGSFLLPFNFAVSSSGTNSATNLVLSPGKYVVVVNQEVDGSFKCSGNPICQVNGGGASCLESGGKAWYSCSANDSVIFDVVAPPVSPTPAPAAQCTQLLNMITNSFGATCSSANYSAVADVNKDRTINILDASLVGGKSTNGAACQVHLNDTSNPCTPPTPTRTPTPSYAPAPWVNTNYTAKS
jgi:hypothetical protein